MQDSVQDAAVIREAFDAGPTVAVLDALSLLHQFGVSLVPWRPTMHYEYLQGHSQIIPY